MKRSRLLAAVLAVSALSVLPHSATAQVAGAPARIDYQGQVNDSNGNPLAPVTPTNYRMEFRIYDSQTGGTRIWSEMQTVTVSNGAFSVRLGEGIPIPGEESPADLVSTFISGKERYLGLTVVIPGQTSGEITPRLAFLSSPFSLVSERSLESETMSVLNNAGTRIGSASWNAVVANAAAAQAEWKLKDTVVPANVAVPVGGVIMWWGSLSQIPDGFELCDGAAPAPGSLLTGVKPDLRDKFVKGATSGATDVKQNPVTGGRHATQVSRTGLTELTRSQLPNYTLPHNLGTAAAGAHRHNIESGDGPNNRAAPTDEGKDGYFAGGDADNHEAFRPLRTTENGSHTHAITGTISLGGSGQGHDHVIPSHDNRPEFLELFYIIRVR